MDSLNNPALIVLAWGNISRGDDAAGPLLAEKIQQLNLDGVVLQEDLQLNIEHVMDLHSQIPVLFIDASCKPEHGFHLERISAEPDSSISTHSVSPGALLHLFEKTHGSSAPEAFMLHISGKSLNWVSLLAHIPNPHWIWPGNICRICSACPRGSGCIILGRVAPNKEGS